MYSNRTESLSYDDIIALYFATKPEFRKNGVWLMNDNTALTLRTLKDKDGNYLWRQSDDTIHSRPVVISPYMPDIAADSIPVAQNGLAAELDSIAQRDDVTPAEQEKNTVLI